MVGYSNFVETTDILEALERDIRDASRAYHSDWDNAAHKSLEDFLMRLKLMQHRIGVLLDRWDD